MHIYIETGKQKATPTDRLRRLRTTIDEAHSFEYAPLQIHNDLPLFK